MDGMQDYVKLGTKGEFVVPKLLRVNLNYKKGNILNVMKVNDMMIVKKVDTSMSEEEIMLVKEIQKAIHSLECGKGRTFTYEKYMEHMDKEISKQ
ncbi:MAG: hypothetical protein PHS34_08445 [Candidatus Omnitrophica bacterium]|nr:hypothetical protein [Candidatus Nanoarchaeia archaeon]MDD5551274.1 hypothetical protein [Candidatus Omnitrophota bacterium]